jgi:hypothetical protein
LVKFLIGAKTDQRAMIGRFLFVVLALFGCFTFVSSTPAECTKSVQVLGMEDHETLSWFFGENNCDPRKVCKYNCKSCNKEIYYDLSTFYFWNFPKYQNAWKNSCKNQNIRIWLDTNVDNETLKLQASKISVDRLKEVLYETFNSVYTEYKKICKGKFKVIDWAFKASLHFIYFGHKVKDFFWNLSAIPQYGQFLKISDSLFDKFMIALDQNIFQFCSCDLFVNNLDQNYKNFFNSFAEKNCQKKCNTSGSLVLEYEE